MRCYSFFKLPAPHLPKSDEAAAVTFLIQYLTAPKGTALSGRSSFASVFLSH
jgi:hypothetical protein